MVIFHQNTFLCMQILCHYFDLFYLNTDLWVVGPRYNLNNDVQLENICLHYNLDMRALALNSDPDRRVDLLELHTAVMMNVRHLGLDGDVLLMFFHLLRKVIVAAVSELLCLVDVVRLV